MTISYIAILTLAGFSFQLKIAYDSFKAASKLRKSIEEKFNQLYTEYKLKKQEVELSITKASKACQEKDTDLLRLHLQSAEYGFRDLQFRLRNVERNLNFPSNDVSLFTKLFSLISLIGSAWLCLFNYNMSSQLDSRLEIFSRIMKCSIMVFAGIFSVFYSYNNLVTDKTLKIIRSESVAIDTFLKTQIDSLKKL